MTDRRLLALIAWLASAVSIAAPAQDAPIGNPAPPATPATAPAPRPSVEIFIPREKITADSSVSFPVDI